MWTANGMIVAMGNVAENASNYAYVWAYDADDTGIDSDRVKVTLSDGTTKTYTLADKSDLSKKITNDLTSERRTITPRCSASTPTPSTRTARSS